MNQLPIHRAQYLNAIAVLAWLFSSGGSPPPRQVISVQSPTDLSVRLVAEPSAVAPGDKLTLTATLTNLGPAEATFVDVTFALPDQLRAVSAACDRGISPDGPSCEYSSLEAGGVVTCTLVVTPAGPADIGDRRLGVTATASFEDVGVIDANPANNSETLAIVVAGKPSSP